MWKPGTLISDCRPRQDARSQKGPSRCSRFHVSIHGGVSKRSRKYASSIT
jgi:hypothetical protein